MEFDPLTTGVISRPRFQPISLSLGTENSNDCIRTAKTTSEFGISAVAIFHAAVDLLISNCEKLKPLKIWSERCAVETMGVCTHMHARFPAMKVILNSIDVNYKCRIEEV